MHKTLNGICVCPGDISGKARIINNKGDIEKVEFGEIIVLPNSNPIYAEAVMKAAGVICENGGKLSHICIVSMEMGIPCITQVRGVISIINTGNKITLNATKGEIHIWKEMID